MYKRQLTDRLAREVRARCGPDVITCDSAEPRSIAGLRACGLRVTAARKGPDSIGHGDVYKRQAQNGQIRRKGKVAQGIKIAQQKIRHIA